MSLCIMLLKCMYSMASHTLWKMPLTVCLSVSSCSFMQSKRVPFSAYQRMMKVVCAFSSKMQSYIWMMLGCLSFICTSTSLRASFLLIFFIATVMPVFKHLPSCTEPQAPNPRWHGIPLVVTSSQFFKIDFLGYIFQ